MSILGRLAMGSLFGGRGRTRTSVSVEITENRFDEARRDIHRAMRETLEEIADEIVDDARRRAPVASGHLRDSIKAQRQ